jgi:mannitol-1-phosphate/altronate dehydrogenase
VRDPLSNVLKQASDVSRDPVEKAVNLLAIDAVFDPKLSQNRKFREAVTSAFGMLCEKGARAAVAVYGG